MKLKIAGMLVTLAVVVLGATVAFGGGHNSSQLERAGWGCSIQGPNGWVHCANVNGEGLTIKVMVFSADGNIFLGSELLIHDSVYRGQPCATDDGDSYHLLGNGYRACHHFETP